MPELPWLAQARRTLKTLRKQGLDNQAAALECLMMAGAWSGQRVEAAGGRSVPRSWQDSETASRPAL